MHTDSATDWCSSFGDDVWKNMQRIFYQSIMLHFSFSHPRDKIYCGNEITSDKICWGWTAGLLSAYLFWDKPANIFLDANKFTKSYDQNYCIHLAFSFPPQLDANETEGRKYRIRPDFKEDPSFKRLTDHNHTAVHIPTDIYDGCESTYTHPHTHTDTRTDTHIHKELKW